MVLEVEYTGLRKTALPMRPRVSVLDSALRNGNFSLRINPVRSDDAGLYEAQVTYNTEVRSCQVELGVVTGKRRWKPWRTLILGGCMGGGVVWHSVLSTDSGPPKAHSFLPSTLAFGEGCLKDKTGTEGGQREGLVVLL